MQRVEWRPVLRAGLATVLGLLSGCDRTVTLTGSGDPPVIQAISASPVSIAIGNASLISVVATDPQGGLLTYEWDAGLGDIFGTAADVYYTAQWCCLGANDITVRVINESGGSAVATVRVTAYAPP